MVKHGIDIISSITQYLNPGHVPVVPCDQPIFAIGKQVQWSWPQQYGSRASLKNMFVCGNPTGRVEKSLKSRLKKSLKNRPGETFFYQVIFFCVLGDVS
jgi:hypothetical protein